MAQLLKIPRSKLRGSRLHEVPQTMRFANLFKSVPLLCKGFLFPILILATSCVSSEQTNPLHNQIDALFLPAITRPLSGEQWFTGSNREINWRFPLDISDSLVTLQLFCDGQLLKVIADLPNTGSYSLTVPNHQSIACQVQMVLSNGQIARSGEFIITNPPVLVPLDTGGPAREPAAIREFIIFTSDRSGNADLWLKNRRTEELARLTFYPGDDGEANLFKPNGNVFAFTSERSGRKEIWMMSITEREAKQVTMTGGSNPAWQPSFYQFPIVAYTRSEQVGSSRTHIYATRLQIATTNIVPLPAAIPVFPEDQITSGSSNPGSISNIISLDWGAPGTDNAIIYDSGNPGLLWRLKVPFEGIAINGRSRPDFFNVPGVLSADHPSFSISGAKIAFSSGGDLWVIPLTGGAPTQLTSGPEEDDFPDWASESEIIFQRRSSPSDAWGLWAIQLSG